MTQLGGQMRTRKWMKRESKKRALDEVLRSPQAMAEKGDLVKEAEKKQLVW